MAVLGVAAMFAVAPSSGEPLPARKDELVYLLRQDCGSCHGLQLRGGLGPPLTASALAARPPRLLEDMILNGIPGTPMPPWKMLLTPGEVSWLVATMKRGLRRAQPGETTR